MSLSIVTNMPHLFLGETTPAIAFMKKERHKCVKILESLIRQISTIENQLLAIDRISAILSPERIKREIEMATKELEDISQNTEKCHMRIEELEMGLRKAERMRACTLPTMRKVSELSH